VAMVQASDDEGFTLPNQNVTIFNKETWSNNCGKNMLKVNKIVWTGASVTMHMESNDHVHTTKEVRFYLPTGICIVSCHDMPLTMHMECHLMVLDVNGLLCETIHVKSGK
jgi:hypothetical protein